MVRNCSILGCEKTSYAILSCYNQDYGLYDFLFTESTAWRERPPRRGHGKGFETFCTQPETQVDFLIFRPRIVRSVRVKKRLTGKAARLIGDAGCWLEARGALAPVTPRREKRGSSSQCRFPERQPPSDRFVDADDDRSGDSAI
jgi:hypothetical protein